MWPPFGGRGGKEAFGPYKLSLGAAACGAGPSQSLASQLLGTLTFFLLSSVRASGDVEPAIDQELWAGAVVLWAGAVNK